MSIWHINTPLDKEILAQLQSGDTVFLSGIIYSCRDTVHRYFIENLKQNKALPFNIKGAAIYYMGPSPTEPNKIIGACGPTTSYRMDTYTPALYDLGLGASIGKGKRSQEVKNSIVKNKSVYLGATGGAGALYAGCVLAAEIIAYPELGPEALRKITVKDMPLIVINDAYGHDLYMEK